ncbi:MAG: hypothetical protein M0P23_07265, partial [Bacteroidales bacterium]|nr:hypothetical protein [Bacteroidales bacterium]
MEIRNFATSLRVDPLEEEHPLCRDKMKNKDDKKAILYVSVTVLSWSTVASAFKLALSSLTYYELLLISSITALIAFAIIL